MKGVQDNAVPRGAKASSRRGLLARVALSCASRPRLVITAWVVAAALLALAGQNGASSLETSDILIEGTPSANAVQLERTRFGESQSLAVLLKGSAAQIERHGPKAVRRLEHIQQLSVLSPWSPNAPEILRPKRGQALLILQVARPYSVTGTETVPAVREELHKVLPGSMRSYVTGNAALAGELNRVGFEAARTSERIAAPLLIVILLLVFRSPIAALIPGLLGVAAIICGGGIVALLSRIIAVDALATVTMSMMGLALGVDYSLLIVSRFREELVAGRSRYAALERTAATAGRTVIFAGLILVFAMFAALIFAPRGMMTSSTVGVIGATTIATVGSATLLPALLAILAPYLERWRLGSRVPRAQIGSVVKRLIRRPAVVTIAIVVPLLALSGAAFGLELGAPAANALPDDNPVRGEYNEIKKQVGGGWTAPFTIIAVAEDGPITQRKRLAALDRFQRRLTGQQGVANVLGLAAFNAESKKLTKAVDDLAPQHKGQEKLDGGLGDTESGMVEKVGRFDQGDGPADATEQQASTLKSGYFLLAGIEGGDPDEQEGTAFTLNLNKGGSAARIMVIPGGDEPETGQADAGPADVRKLSELSTRLKKMTLKLADELDAETAVGGRGSVLTDFVETANGSILPLMVTLVAVALLLLTVVFRSPLLAVKAVALNLLTVGAALGVLMLVTTGEEPLIGGPGFLDAISLFSILTIVFALSIDYEVFMITRMREGYVKTGTTEGAIAYGIDHTARVITGAAAIMIGVFFAFGIADFMTVRALGVGTGVAVFLDATVVRLILLPATMKLFGRANFWMPRWLDRLLPNIAVEGKVRR